MEERLYLSITGDSATIHHRPTHEFIACGDLKGMAKKVKELLAMTTDDFYFYLVNNVPFIKLEGKTTKPYKSNFNEQEDWYKKAWISGTTKFFKEFRLKQVNEEVPLELVDKLYDDKRHREDKGQSAFSSVVEDEDEVKWIGSPVKKKLVKTSEIDTISVMNVLNNAKRKLVATNKPEKTRKLIRSH